jgi:hypothetical protein
MIGQVLRSGFLPSLSSHGGRSNIAFNRSFLRWAADTQAATVRSPRWASPHVTFFLMRFRIDARHAAIVGYNHGARCMGRVKDAYGSQ